MADNNTLVHIGADISDLERATKLMQREFEAMGKTIDAGMSNANDAINKVAVALTNQSMQLNQLGLQWQKIGKEQTEAITQRFDKLLGLMEKLVISNENVSRATKNTVREIVNLNNALTGTGSQANTTGQEFNNMGNRGTKATRNLKNEIGILQKSLEYLKWTITRVFWFGAVLQFQKALTGIVTEGGKWEKTISSLTAITEGNIDLAIQLESVYSDLGREIPFTSDEISKSALILNKTGLKPTRDLLISLGKIATGTGQSMFTQATALTSVVTGNLRGLRMMGIEAKDNGDTLIMSYKGQTEQIKKNTKALEDYIKRFADTNFTETLNFQMNGLSGKIHRLNEDWGNLSKAMHQAGGKMIVGDILDGIQEKVSSLIAYFNKPETKEAISLLWSKFKDAQETLKKLAGFITTNLKNALQTVSEKIIGIGDTTDKVASKMEERFGAFGRIANNVLNGVQATVLGLLNRIDEVNNGGLFVLRRGMTQEQGVAMASALNNIKLDPNKLEKFAKNFNEAMIEAVREQNNKGRTLSQEGMDNLYQITMPSAYPQLKAITEKAKNELNKALEDRKQLKQQLIALEQEARLNPTFDNSKLQDIQQKYDENTQQIISLNKQTQIDYQNAKRIVEQKKKTNNELMQGALDFVYDGKSLDDLTEFNFDNSQYFKILNQAINATNAKDVYAETLNNQASTPDSGGLIASMANALELLQKKDKETLDKLNQNADEIKDSAEDLKNKSDETNKTLEDILGGNGTDFSNNGKGSNGSGKSVKTPKDTWTPYFRSLENDALKNKNRLIQINASYSKDLEELEQKAQENSFVTAKMKNDAKILLDEQYYQKVMELKQQASEFVFGLDDSNAEILKIQTEYQEKLQLLEEYHEAQLISEQVFQEKYRQIMEQTNRKLAESEFKKSMEPYKKTGDVLSSIADGFSQLTSNLDKNSQAYRVAFSIQKGFAVASATTSAVLAWMQALSDPSAMTWPQKLANYAMAIAMTTQVLAQLASISMHDKGGNIPAGGLGIVGEYGPELVSGPASVTSRKKTEDLLSGSRGDVIVNLYEDSSRAGQVSQQKNDNETIINIIVNSIRNGGEVDGAISNTYGMKRVGA